MTAKIRVLEKSVSEKIAAGEVVENPASVVKELLENSIDAGATSIAIEIENGGKTLIRVTDNGEGIDREDVRTAFRRHATSKISNIEDLDRIVSLGFRGEALASIAAVSMVRMVTKPRNSLEGTVYEMHGGQEVMFEEVGCPGGTSIEVKELFYNTPARKEYLRSSSHEGSLISDIITRLALARTGISFRLTNNGKMVINTPGNGELRDTIVSIYGREIGENLVKVSCSREGIGIDGFVSKPHITRSNRGYQSIFVNGRYIKNRMVTQAIEDSYRTMLMVNRYPVAVLNIVLDPCLVDVNVHPAKLQVRFKDENLVKGAIYDCIKTCMEKGRWISSVASFGRPAGGQARQDVTIKSWSDNNITKEKIQPEHGNNCLKEERVEYNRIELDNIIKDNDNNIPELRIVGQLLNTYIAAEGDGCVYLIDQHAAHERVMYEMMTLQFENNGINSQRLLDPIVMELSHYEAEIIKENLEVIRKTGFELEEFGVNSIAVRSVPVFFGIPETKEFINDLITEYTTGNRRKGYRLKSEEVIGMACKKAVKANQRLSMQEMEGLIAQLRKAKMPYTCPHGRPVIITLSKYELEKMFKRVQ
ncbi:MAG: DNA mismatch repair endonuclease MutL [Bacillota bacterium]|nr:DNA mismatch repair endonuclease MutL [Bacillota bacterium]